LEAALDYYNRSVTALEKILGRADCPLTAKALLGEAQKGQTETVARLKKTSK
jgi:hypothetical protein